MFKNVRAETTDDREDRVNHETLSALTVVIGTAQLMERRLARNASLSNDETMASLKSIRKHAWIIERKLHELRAVDRCRVSQIDE